MAITNIYKGALERSDIQKIYKGTTLLYEKVLAPQGETWVINENPIIAETIDFDNIVIDGLDEQHIGGQIFYVNLSVPVQVENKIIRFNKPSVDIFTNGVWVSQEYRTITFEEAPMGDLLTWLQANAVKQ